MSWNDGYERKKFEKKQAAQAEQYRLLGMNTDRENNIFGALKLIEQLYLDGEISGHVFCNILQEYKDVVCIADFTCYKKDKQKGGNT